jgi:hypothetical protein
MLVIRFGMCIFEEGSDLKLVRILCLLDPLALALAMIQAGAGIQVQWWS